MSVKQNESEFRVSIEIGAKTREDDLYDKFSGILLGSAIADALGWVTEFLKSREQLKKLYGMDKMTNFVSWKKKTGGRFYSYIDYVQPGEYSDDTQLTLCTARSLKPDGKCDMDHFSKIELPCWLDYARGAGRTVTFAAKAIQRKSASWHNNFFQVRTAKGYLLDYRGAGANGAAMRISPIVLANGNGYASTYEEIWKNVIVTHGHPRAILGAETYGKALYEVLHRRQQDAHKLIRDLKGFVRDCHIPTDINAVKDWLDRWNYKQKIPFESEFDNTKREIIDQLTFIEQSAKAASTEVLRQLGCFDAATKGSGTSTVSAAIALFGKYVGNYREAVIEAVNLIGADTDTIGLMAGGLSAAVEGYISIPDQWAVRLQDYGYFVRVAKALTRIHLRKSKGNDLLPDHPNLPEQVPDITRIIREGQVRRGQRVKHQLFALGWVHEAMAGWVKRYGGATINLAHVEFDMGQSCWFRAYSTKQPGRSRALLKQDASQQSKFDI